MINRILVTLAGFVLAFATMIKFMVIFHINLVDAEPEISIAIFLIFGVIANCIYNHLNNGKWWWWKKKESEWENYIKRNEE